MNIEICLTNLTKYTEGTLIGKWVQVAPDTNWTKIENEIGAPGDEFFITDYNANFQIKEYDNPRILSDIVKVVDDENAFYALCQIYDRDYVIELLKNENYSFYPDILNYEDLARDRIGDNLPKEFEGYFKWEEYGETVAINEGGNITAYGYVVAF